MRKILRNIMKRKQKTNKIAKAWRRQQIKKYGPVEWHRMFVRCGGVMIEELEKGGDLIRR